MGHAAHALGPQNGWAKSHENTPHDGPLGTDDFCKIGSRRVLRFGDAGVAFESLIAVSQMVRDDAQKLPNASDPRTTAVIRMVICMGGLRITEISASKKEWYKDGWLCLPTTKNKREHHVPLTEQAKSQYEIAVAVTNSESDYLFPNTYDIREPIDPSSLGKVARRLMSDFDVAPFQLKDLRRTFKTHLLDGEYVEEREIDIWHNRSASAHCSR